MQILPALITYFGAIFAFGFGLAWLLPLILAMEERPPAAPKPLNLWFVLVDLFLVIKGGIPIFLLLGGVRKILRRWPLALEKWKADPGIRQHFRLFGGCATAALMAAMLWSRQT